MSAREAEILGAGTRHAGAGRNPAGSALGAEDDTATTGRTKSKHCRLMEAVVDRNNMQLALRRVMRNRGSAGVDNLSVEGLPGWLMQHWPSVRQALLEGRYLPQAVRRVDIPKPNGGGVRTLGVPTVVDRLIQQAIHQVLQPIFEPTFSAHSYGFRPGRSALDAVSQAREYIQAGRRWVVDLDLEKFFDRVNHDVLLVRLARKVQDERLLKLIRRFLEAGMLADGVVYPRSEGTPQGGPLSPLLSNILLTDLDRELERRRLAFCRYADDCNIYVGSERAGQRVMWQIRTYLEKVLRLRVNAAKSAVARPWKRKFLGYSVTIQKSEVRIRVAPESLQRLIARVRAMLRKRVGQSLHSTIQLLNPVLRGWANYFQLESSRWRLEGVDGWIRRKLRCVLWRQWKTREARCRRLVALGLSPERAWKSSRNGQGPWWNAGARHMSEALPKRLFARLNLVSLHDTVRQLQRIG